MPIPGTTKLHRLEENLGGADITLDALELKAIDTALAQIRIEGERYPEASRRVSVDEQRSRSVAAHGDRRAGQRPLLSLADTQGASQTPRSGSRILVAYFSRSGNTRVVAGLIQRGLGADLFEIRPAYPYPEDYLQTVEQARQERDSGFGARAAREGSRTQRLRHALSRVPDLG